MQGNQGTVEYFKVLWSVPQSIKKTKTLKVLHGTSGDCGIPQSILQSSEEFRVLWNIFEYSRLF